MIFNMYFFGDTFFETTLLKNVFQITFCILVISELIICYSSSIINSHSGGHKEKKDRGSCILIIFGFWISIGADAILRKNINLVLPVLFFWIGIALTIGGIIFRWISILTLKKAFTICVQVSSEQNIIKTGPYKYLRHPAYCGSILSLIGISLCFRTILGLVVTLLLISLIYGYRIKIEEKALEKSFGDEYKEYEKKTWRLVPYIW